MIATAPQLGRFVVNLGRLSQIPRGEGRSFRVGGWSIAVFHTRRGEVFVTEASCPHKAGPLADGVIGDGKVSCPLHAFVFDLSSGRPVGNSCRSLKTYPAFVNEDGEVFVAVDGLVAAP